jgi:hypothetical protein
MSDVSPLAATLTSISPTQGKIQGGGQIQVVGTNFTPSGLGIYLEGAAQPSAIFTYTSPTTGRFNIPAGVPNDETHTGEVQLWDTGVGVELGSLPYRWYAWPQNLSIFPSSGPIMGGNRVDIYGTDLDTVGASGVVIDKGGGHPFTLVDSGHLWLTMPAEYAGRARQVSIDVSNDAGYSTVWYNYTSQAITPPIPGTPVPRNRGRYVVTLHARHWLPQSWNVSMLAELSDARSRHLTQAWDAPAEFTFTIDGKSPQANKIVELATDVVVRRWDEQSGQDVCIFRGIVDHTEDQLSADVHVVNVTCHDYLSMLQRGRILTSLLTYTQIDQDNIVSDFVQKSVAVVSSGGAYSTGGNNPVDFRPACYLPMHFAMVASDGSARQALSGRLRDRSYPASTQIGQALDDLAKVIGGFDYDLLPAQANETEDTLRVFYPSQGIVRSGVVLMYGSTVSEVTRTVSSEQYANYERVLGNNNSTDSAAPQLFAEAWNDAAVDVAVDPKVGLFMFGDNASDVNQATTLYEKAQGDIAHTTGVLVPSYTLTLEPTFYKWGRPNMGDICPLIILSGRLNVNTTVRVVGIEYDIGDDDYEDVKLTVGRPGLRLVEMFTKADRDVDALSRR